MYKKIKEIVSERGKDYLLTGKQFVNLMADRGAFNDPDDKPYQRLILGLVEQHYIERLLDVGAWNDEAKTIASEFARKNMLDQDGVNYVFSCIAYGLSWIKTPPRKLTTKNKQKNQNFDSTTKGKPVSARAEKKKIEVARNEAKGNAIEESERKAEYERGMREAPAFVRAERKKAKEEAKRKAKEEAERQAREKAKCKAEKKAARKERFEDAVCIAVGLFLEFMEKLLRFLKWVVIVLLVLGALFVLGVFL